MIRKCISCALKLSDGITKQALTASSVRMYVDGMPIKFEYKQGGYFILIDLEEGTHTVTLQSHCYQTEVFTVCVDDSVIMRPESMVRYIVLNPSEKHPRASSMPTVRGIAEGFDRIYLQRRVGEMKIAEDDASEGKTEIRLFSPKSGAMLPSLYMINDRSAAKCEIVMLKGANGDMYMLDTPLRYAHPRSAEVVPLTGIGCGADGSFYFMLPSDLTAANGDAETPLAILAEKDGKLYRTEVTAKRKGMTELGTLEFKKG